MCALQAGIERYLRENGSPYSIMKGDEFLGCRDVLEGKAKYLRQNLGMGKHPNKADSLTPAKEEELWNAKQLGSHNPRSVINTMWFLLTQHFGLRGRQE